MRAWRGVRERDAAAVCANIYLRWVTLHTRLQMRLQTRMPMCLPTRLRSRAGTPLQRAFQACGMRGKWRAVATGSGSDEPRNPGGMQCLPT